MSAVKGTLVSSTGVRIPGTQIFVGETYMDVRIDGSGSSNTFSTSEGWTFEPDVVVPTKHGIWLYWSYGLDDDGDLSDFPNLIPHLPGGWFAIGNADGIRMPLSEAEVERIFRHDKPAALTLKQEVSS
jgi:hypothetical protein